MKSIISIFLVFCSLQMYAQKQDKPQLDTIYYLADTSKVPKNDRMLTIGTEVYSRSGKLDTISYFRIDCACLPYGYYPTFTRHLNQPQNKNIKQDTVQLKFTSLSKLLSIILRDYKKEFNYKHVVIMVEMFKEKYSFNQVFLTEFQNPTTDYEIIKP